MRRINLASICIVAVLLVGLVISSCAPKAAPAPSQAPAAKVAPSQVPATKPAAPSAKPVPAKTLDIACGAASMPSSTYVLGVAVIKMINKYVPNVTAYVATYPSNAAFPDYFTDHIIDLATSGTNTGSAVFATGEWKGHGSAPIRYIGMGPTAYYGIVANPASGIKTPADLKGKKWMAIRPGSISGKERSEAYLKVYGLTDKDVTIMSHSSADDLTNALKEGKVDAVLWPYYKATPWLQELALVGKGLPVTDTPEAIAKLVAMLPIYTPAILPAGSYKGQDKDVATLGTTQCVECRADLPVDLAYAITAALFNNFDEWSGYHSDILDYKLPASLSPVRITIPIHEGAVKYYKEKGYWTAAHEAKQNELLEKVKALGPYKKLK